MFKLAKIVLILILVLLVFLTKPLMGQVGIEKVGQTGMKFLSVPVGARGAAMGDAFIAVANNAEAMFWNPAGMARIGKIDYSAGYNKWVAGISHQHVNLAYNAGNIGVLGVNLIWVNYGTIYGTRRSEIDPRGYVETGPFSPTAMVAGLAYSRAVTDRFAFGINLKYVHQDLGWAYVGTGETTDEFETVNKKLGIWVFDFGSLYHPGFKDLRIAMCVSNVSAERKFEQEAFPLPLTLKIGMAMDLLKAFGIETNSSLTIAIDGVHPRDYTERVHFGVEYCLNNILALRAGYKLNYDEDKSSFGVGFIAPEGGIRIDYSFNPFGNLAAVHRITIGRSL